MPDDAMDRVLRLVAEGRLSADEAAPILDALDVRASTGGTPPDSHSGRATGGNAAGPGARFARIEVAEAGRKAVDLRIPLSLGRRVLGGIPGLSSAHVAELDDAVNRGSLGPIVDITEADGSGVRITLE